MKTFLFLLTMALLPVVAQARPPGPTPLNVFLVDQLPSQTIGPVFNSLDERRRGPIFAAALKRMSTAGKLPPVTILNRDLSLPATVADEPKLPAETPLARVYLTQWSQTGLGGQADTEIICRFFVELRCGDKLVKKLGPFFAQRRFDVTTLATPEARWAQFQTTAQTAIEDFGAALRTTKFPCAGAIPR